MASQKRPSQRHGSKYLATASTMDHARHGFLPRHRDTGILDSIGRFFGGDRGVPKRGSGKVPWLKPGRSPLPRARFPEFLSWEEEIVAPDHPWLDAENPPGSGILSSAS
uniref:Myelin basic protein n=1 Tax=Macaca fascicularis TaxID=9541 RepID=I7G287_MACFA|nr:unnamed protein product [Macaca fascicularis]